MDLAKALLFGQAVIFGLIVGSFLNVCIYRLPKKLSILGRSFCPHCAKPIPLYRNIPILIYALQGGKSACCKKPIGFQYPLVEALTALLSLLVVLNVTSFDAYFLWFCLFICPLIVLSFIDLKLKIIPDVITLPFIIAGLGVNLYFKWPDWPVVLKTNGLGALIGGGTLLILAEVISRLKKRDAMGGGDIKLAAMLGAFLGFKPLIFVFFVASVLALIYAFAVLFSSRDKDQTIPFGPFLSLGAIIFWLYGKQLTDLYFFDVLNLGRNPFF